MSMNGPSNHAILLKNLSNNRGKIYHIEKYYYEKILPIIKALSKEGKYFFIIHDQGYDEEIYKDILNKNNYNSFRKFLKEKGFKISKRIYSIKISWK